MNGLKFHQVRVSAPGKVILHGEHSVVYGKTAIAVSLGLRTSIVIKETPSNAEPTLTLHLVSVGLADEKLSLSSIAEKLFDPPFQAGTGECPWTEPDKLDHAKHMGKVEQFLHEVRPDFVSLKNEQKNSLRGFLYAFSAIFGGAKVPLNSIEARMESELIVGAGTGSSASFAVTLVGAFLRLLKLKTGTEDAEFSMKDKQIISGWAYNCERITHGSPSGIDNSTCTFGSLVSFRKGAAPRILNLGLHLRVLLVDTGVSRETKALTAKVAALRQWNTGAVDSVMEACDHVTRTATEILEMISKSKRNTEIQKQYQQLEELWHMNHCLLASLGVSHPALEAVRATAATHGFASKLTGAGGGGYAIVLVPPYREQAKVDSLYEDLVSKGFRVTDTQLGGAGVKVDS